MDKNTQIQLYTKLYLARASELGIIKYYHEDDMKTPMHMSYGQEIISVSVCQALRKEDQVFGTYRSHALYLSKVGNLEKFFGEMYGKINGMVNGKAGSMHMSDKEFGFMGSSAIVASTIPCAVGAAFAHKYLNDGIITAVFFGDGAIDEGNFWESVNIATTMQLPVLFILEDNGLAVHTNSNSRHGYTNITDVMKKFAFSYIYEWDATIKFSNTVETLYECAIEAVHCIKLYNKPAFITIKIERELEHVGINSDYNVGYRKQPHNHETNFVSIYKQHLLADKVVTLAKINKIEKDIDLQIEDAIQKAKSASFPVSEELYNGVFACEK